MKNQKPFRKNEKIFNIDLKLLFREALGDETSVSEVIGGEALTSEVMSNWR